MTNVTGIWGYTPAITPLSRSVNSSNNVNADIQFSHAASANHPSASTELNIYK